MYNYNEVSHSHSLLPLRGVDPPVLRLVSHQALEITESQKLLYKSQFNAYIK